MVGTVTDIPPQFGFISFQLARVFAQLTPILPDLVSRLANLLEILSNLRLIVVAAIAVTDVSPKAMIITAPVMASPLMTTIPPPSMFSATIYVMPKMLLISAPVMAVPFAVLAILPHAILGVSRRGDSWEN
jgi:hypothetical protein